MGNYHMYMYMYRFVIWLGGVLKNVRVRLHVDQRFLAAAKCCQLSVSGVITSAITA